MILNRKQYMNIHNLSLDTQQTSDDGLTIWATCLFHNKGNLFVPQFNRVTCLSPKLKANGVILFVLQ